jgi:DNA polymerase-3 subunit delta'
VPERAAAPGAALPPPAANPVLIGQERAEAAFLNAWRSGRPAHGWLLAGPRGIGKETLAFRIARFVLSGGTAETLACDPAAPLFRRVAAGGHSDLHVLTRQINERTGRRRAEIVIEDARALCAFLALTAGEGGWRVAIVDGAEDMNRNAANAILKVLEEPPPRTLLLLVSHAPGRLLPTIRSRCWLLPLRPLGEAELVRVLGPALDGLEPGARGLVLTFVEGSPGLAAALLEADGAELCRTLSEMMADLPRLDASRVHALADRLSGTEGAETFRLIGELLLGLVARAVRGRVLGTAPAGPGALDHWIEVWDNLRRLFARAEALDLEPRQTLIGAFGGLERAARG